MKDKERDVFAEAAAQMHKGFPVLVKTGIQDKAQLERLYPKGGEGKSSNPRHPTQNVTDFLPEAHKTLIDALERVLLDPAIAALPPTEQARLAAQLLIAESDANPSDLIELSKVEQMAAYYEAPKGFFDWLDAMRGIKLDIPDDLKAE